MDPVARLTSSENYFTDPQQWNAYAYARNNPVKFVDPNGESSSNLNNKEILTALIHPIKSYQAKQISDYVIKNTINNFQSKSKVMWNNEADAYRHALWSAMMTYKFSSEEIAKKFTDNHEANTEQHVLEKEMDDYNNKIGQEIGKLFIGKKDVNSTEIENTVKEYLNDGKLRILTTEEHIKVVQYHENINKKNLEQNQKDNYNKESKSNK